MASKVLFRKLTAYLLTIMMGFNGSTVAVDAMSDTLVAPIEVIEEWGCYDTEIRLTCGNLESRIAILEAKFTPRCAAERAEDCVHLDEHRITHTFSSQRIDKLTLQEKEAGQRFLQTLRRNHDHENEREENIPSIAASIQPANGSANVRAVKDKRSSMRATLEHMIVRYLRRITSSGEEDREDEHGGYESSSMRYRRQAAATAMVDANGTEPGSGSDNTTEVAGNEGLLGSSVEITLLTNDTDSGIIINGSVVGNLGEQHGEPFAKSDAESVKENVYVLPSAQVSSEEEKSSKIVYDSGERPPARSRKHKPKKKECTSVRQRIAQLDRFELEKSMRNDSFREYNIRNALNYRCSGKNHCSFVFAQDHPFAVIWREGTVRVKYLCMDDFRISRYCDEHLIIGNEAQWERRRDNQPSNETHDVSGPETTMETTASATMDGDESGQLLHHSSGYEAGKSYYNGHNLPGFAEDRNQWSYDTSSYYEEDHQLQPDEYDAPRGEPRAEALQQQQVQQMHSLHNLKILKPVPGEEAAINDVENQRQLEAEAANRKRQRQRQKVFSQDFRLLKILPSNLDKVEDIKQVGDEYYFKKDVEVTDVSENEIEPGEGASKNESNQFTETLDIVVLPPPTKDADVYESDFDQPLEDTGRNTTYLPVASSPLPVVGPIQNVSEMITTTTGFITSGRIDVDKVQDLITFSTTAISSPTAVASTVSEDSLEKYSGIESNEIQEDRKPNKTSSEDSFNFNNRTFKKIQEAVREEMGESQSGTVEGYPGSYDDDDDDDFDEDDSDDDYDDHESRSHRKYISIQRTLLKHPLRQGFLMTPGYPKYYIGDSICRWTLYAERHQKIKLTILDLALRQDEPCKDYVEIRDLNTNRTLFSSCSESTRPIEVISVEEQVQVNVRTTTKVAYPKRGVLIHYAEKRDTEGSGLVSHYEQKRKISDSENMSDKQADTVYDILIPSMIIAALFIVNGIVFAVIMRYRNKRKQRLELDSKELAEL
ncbi:uncharacterized protein LOC129779793 isoform X2 [Toxorhynchites rutilus septentrionalis]|uniref:uncharacterized protein LOC129779793 isoform X2 n=1 Tax=Toxorhynchites rutilus septentrionalis TaxID=329112 RepID=UPI0024787D8C|nr:uncharacterized protein LOC129779793 isoform X2 [Toxorhynchites rutilus septentrionalis]